MGETDKKYTKRCGFCLYIKNHKEIFINAVIICVLVISIGMLFFSNQKLRNSVQEERVEAVAQIGYLLTDRIEQLRVNYKDQVSQIVYIINYEQPDTFEEMVQYFSNPDDWIVLDEKGIFSTLDGKSAILTQNSELINKALNNKELFSSFISIQGKGDYWAFTQSIDGLKVSDKNILGLIRLVPAEEFSSITVMSLYDHMGASYIVDSQGVIVMHPEENIQQELLQGYNIFTSLKKAGISEEEYRDLKDAIESLGVYQCTYTVNNISWLVQALPSTSDYELLVTIPISLTAQETYSGLTTLMISLALVCICGALLLFYNQYNLMKKRRTAQIQLAKAAAKSDFMNKMSHDIRTPLNAVVGLHDLALESIEDKDVVYDCIIKAQASNQYLIALINDVLDMSRIESGKMKINQMRFDLDELLMHVMQMEEQSAADAGLKFTFSENKKSKMDYIGDSVRIRQCLMNLLSNAIKFTPKGGQVSLSVSRTSLNTEADQIRFIVEDTGVGMSKEYMENIFTPFEQEQNSMTQSAVAGSGLGLSIVSNLVRLMGGTISVKSTKGVGSRFEIILSLKKEEKVNRKIETTVSEDILYKTLEGKHILLVEDHAINRQIIARLLAKMGLLVEEAENGQVGVEKFAASEINFYSMVLMDIKMPIMDGLEATRAIRSLRREDAKTITIIALSANAFEEDMKESIDAGMQMHLAKPVDIIELKKILVKYIVGGMKE